MKMFLSHLLLALLMLCIAKSSVDAFDCDADVDEQAQCLVDDLKELEVQNDLLFNEMEKLKALVQGIDCSGGGGSSGGSGGDNGGTANVNECDGEPCKAGEMCIDTPGSYVCVPPATGGGGGGGGGVSNYVRYGKTACPDVAGTTLLYEGVVGGSRYNQHGGGSEYLCLPVEPEWLEYDDAISGMRGLMYGTEYELETKKPLGDNFPLDDHQVPCAVCEASRPSHIMIPAKMTCPDGWTKEFDGYLFSGRSIHVSKTSFVCMDKEPEAVPNTLPNHDGALLYMVEGRCDGSLMCAPYVNGRELTCVVCTM